MWTKPKSGTTSRRSNDDMPKCKQTGVVVTGQTAFMNHGKPQAVDGSIVQCGCSYGSNVVIAGEKPAMSRVFSPVSSENQYQR